MTAPKLLKGSDYVLKLIKFIILQLCKKKREAFSLEVSNVQEMLPKSTDFDMDQTYIL